MKNYDESWTRALRTSACAAVAGALLLTGCSSKAETDETGGGIKTGPGVSDSEIKLGVITDLSGPFSSQGSRILNAQTLYFDRVNEEGGVCGREVVVEAEDHKFDPQEAALAYQKLQSEVLGMAQLMGSTMTATVGDMAKDDDMLVMSLGQSLTLLENPSVTIPGTTYDVETLNQIGYYVAEGVLAEGDAVGVIAFNGDVIDSIGIGLDYAAEELDLTVVEQPVAPADADLGAQLRSLRAAGVKVILINATPKQLASVVGTSESLGWDVPIMASGTTYGRDLLETNVAHAIEERVLISSPFAPFGAEGVTQAVEFAGAYSEAFPNDAGPDEDVNFGIVTGIAYEAILEKACENGDLSREGILTALPEVDNVDLGGLAGDLDFSREGAATIENFILKPDRSRSDGQAVVQPLGASDLAVSYSSGQ